MSALGRITRGSHIAYYSLMFFIAYTCKGQVHVFAGRVKIVSHSSYRTCAILKYFVPCCWLFACIILLFTDIFSKLTFAKKNLLGLNIHQSVKQFGSRSFPAVVFSTCMLGNFSCFCCPLIYFKINFFKKFFNEHYQIDKRFGYRSRWRFCWSWSR